MCSLPYTLSFKRTSPALQGKIHITPWHSLTHFFSRKKKKKMSLHVIKLWQMHSFVSPKLHICAKYEDGNKKYAHSAYIAPYIPFLPLFHLCNISFSCTIIFSQPFDCLLHVSNDVIFISFIHFFQMLIFLRYLQNLSY